MSVATIQPKMFAELCRTGEKIELIDRRSGIRRVNPFAGERSFCISQYQLPHGAPVDRR